MSSRTYEGLKELLDELTQKQFKAGEGKFLPIDFIMVDGNYSQSSDAVYKCIQQSGHYPRVMPSHGKHIGAATKPFSEYKRKKGDRIGHFWRSPMPFKRDIRHMLYDTNYWKSFVYEALSVSLGESGAIEIYGDKPRHHEQLASHILAEYAVKTEGRNRVCWEWKQRPDSPDNHLFDCIVGCCVAAASQGMMAKKWKNQTTAPRRSGPKRQYGAASKI